MHVRIKEGMVWTHLWQWTEVLQNVPIPLPASPAEMGEEEVHLGLMEVRATDAVQFLDL